MKRSKNREDQPSIYTRTGGFPMISRCNVAQKRKRTYHNRQSLHVVRSSGRKKEKQLAHGEGRTRSLQIARRS